MRNQRKRWKQARKRREKYKRQHCQRTGKKIFHTEEDAVGYGEVRKATGRWPYEVIRAYVCPYCNKYHLTHHAECPDKTRFEIEDERKAEYRYRIEMQWAKKKAEERMQS